MSGASNHEVGSNMASNDSMSHVFISYVSEDRDKVDRLCNDLRALGFTIWRDRDSIYPGLRWPTAIRTAIQEGAFFVACFSDNYLARNRSYAWKELNLAIEELKSRPSDRAWFIPVLLTECSAPDREIGGGETLRDIQWVSLHENWENGVCSLAQVFSHRATDAPNAAPAQAPRSTRTEEIQFYHVPWIIVLAFLGGLVGGAIWTFFSRSLGGSVEPHGIAAILWPAVTIFPAMLLIWFYQRSSLGGFKIDYYDVAGFFVGLSIGSWCFYDLPLPGAVGFRGTIDKLTWSFFQKEAVLVVIWTACLSVGGFLPSLIRRLLVLKLGAKKSLSLLIIQVLLVMGPTSAAVITFVNIFPSDTYESGRGILAGILLRLGLIAGLLVAWTRWAPECHGEYH